MVAILDLYFSQTAFRPINISSFQKMSHTTQRISLEMMQDENRDQDEEYIRSQSPENINPCALLVVGKVLCSNTPQCHRATVTFSYILPAVLDVVLDHSREKL